MIALSPTARESGTARVFVTGLDVGYSAAFRQGLDYIGLLDAIKAGDRVVIKPNLTFPEFRNGVMTNPEAVHALVRLLLERTSHIAICESDSGGYNPFSMDEVFRVTGLAEMASRCGVEIVNLSAEAGRDITVKAGRKKLTVPLPVRLLDKTDWFITMPVPKVHANTGLSLSMKNQWGVIQQPSLRLKLHPYFTEVIHAITKALPRPICVMDGKWGLTRNGPMRGDPVELDWTLISDSLYAADYHAAKLMGIDYRRVPHLRHILEREGVAQLETAETNQQSGIRPSSAFYLARAWTDLPGFCTFHSRALAYLGYESPLAQPLHKLLYLFREPFY